MGSNTAQNKGKQFCDLSDVLVFNAFEGFLWVLIITFVIMRRLFADIMVLVTQFQSYKKSYTAHEYCQNFIDVIVFTLSFF